MPFPVINPGDVIRIEDRDAPPVKIKIHVCICMGDQLFMRINSKPIWLPCHMILRKNNQYLDHDSYVELNQLVRHSHRELKEAEVVGRMSSSETKNLIAAAERAETLTTEHKARIKLRLTY